MSMIFFLNFELKTDFLKDLNTAFQALLNLDFFF